MTKSNLQKILIRLVFLTTGLVLNSQVWSQGWNGLNANQTEGIRLRQMNGSHSKDSLTVKTTSNTIIWNSLGIGQTSERFLDTQSSYTFDMQTQFVDFSYTLGESWTTTLGVGIPSGNGEITTSSNAEYNSSTVSGSGYFAIFGLEIGIFEFLVGYRVNNVEYSKFESGSTAIDTKYKVSGGQSMIGLGISSSVVK